MDVWYVSNNILLFTLLILLNRNHKGEEVAEEMEEPPMEHLKEEEALVLRVEAE
jgi:hypothetical protein